MNCNKCNQITELKQFTTFSYHYCNNCKIEVVETKAMGLQSGVGIDWVNKQENVIWSNTAKITPREGIGKLVYQEKSAKHIPINLIDILENETINTDIGITFAKNFMGDWSKQIWNNKK